MIVCYAASLLQCERNVGARASQGAENAFARHADPRDPEADRPIAKLVDAG